MTEPKPRLAKVKNYTTLAKTALSENRHEVLRSIQRAVSSAVWTAIAEECILDAVKSSNDLTISVLIDAAGRVADPCKWDLWLYHSVRRNTHRATKLIFDKSPRNVPPLLLQTAVSQKKRETVEMFIPWCDNSTRLMVTDSAVCIMQGVLPQLLEECEEIGSLYINPTLAIMTQIYYRGKASRPHEMQSFRTKAYCEAQKLAQKRLLELALIFVALPAYVLLEICKKFNFWRLIGPTQEKRTVRLFQSVRDSSPQQKHKHLKVQ